LCYVTDQFKFLGLVTERTREDLTMCFVVRQHIVVADVVRMMTMTIMVFLAYCSFSQKEKQDDRYDQSQVRA
jgi:hypothetical protein